MMGDRSLKELLRILESGRVPSDPSAAEDLASAVREALDARQRIAALEAELAAARKDTERLDWAEDSADNIHIKGYDREDLCVTVIYDVAKRKEGTTLRAAIDAARGRG